MQRILVLLAAMLLLAGCAQDVQPPATTAAPTAEPTTAPTAAPTTVPPETTADTHTTEPVQEYLEVFREGESSLIPVEIVRGSVGNYTMAMDPEYFTYYPQETADLFSYDTWGGPPAVFYSVSDYRDDATVQEFIDSATEQFAHDYEGCTVEEIMIGNYPATAIWFSGRKDAPDYQMHLYLVDCDGSLYLIEAGFVMEMYEGLYAIMRACFDTFTPVD